MKKCEEDEEEEDEEEEKKGRGGGEKEEWKKARSKFFTAALSGFPNHCATRLPTQITWISLCNTTMTRDRHYQRTLHLSSLCALYPGHWSYCSYCSIASRSERRFPWRSLYFQALPRHLALLVVNSALLASPLPLRHKPLLNCAITCEWLRSYHFGSWSFQLDPSSARYRLLQTHSRVRSR